MRKENVLWAHIDVDDLNRLNAIVIVIGRVLNRIGAELVMLNNSTKKHANNRRHNAMVE